MYELKITTLSEDTSNKRGLLAEHGISFLVEYQGFKVLFDTGQGPSVVANARAMNIDLTKINCVALSHGHYDHTGGLFFILRKTGHKRVFAHPAALRPKYHLIPPHSYQAVGIPYAPQELENAGAEFILNSGTTELAPGLYLTGEIPRVTDYETPNPSHFTEADNRYVPDTMPDDQALVAVTSKGPVVITGCAHAGLINTLRCAQQITGSSKIYGLIGGTHLIEANEERLAKTAAQLKEYNLQFCAANHCTGIKAQMSICQSLGDKFFLNNVGNTVKV